jgi:DNA-binding MarR family transcriptional regulator
VTATPQTTGRLLKRAQYRNHRAADRALAEVGTTLVQWDALRAIDEAPSSSAHALAATTFQSDQSFGALAGRLIAHGLIERAPGRGRRIEHRLTDAGRDVLARGEAVLAGVLARSFEALSPTELDTLHDLLERVGEPLG